MKRLLILSLLLWAAGNAWGASYYCSPTGDNGDAGTEVAPWGPLSGVLPAKWDDETIAAGDTLIVMAGVHGSTSFSIAAESMTYIIGDEADPDDVLITRMEVSGSENWTIRDVSIGRGYPGSSVLCGQTKFPVRNIYFKNCNIGRTNDYNTWTTLGMWADSTSIGSADVYGFNINGVNVHVDSCHIKGVFHGIVPGGAGPIFVRNSLIEGFACDGITTGGQHGLVYENNIIANAVKPNEDTHNDGIQLGFTGFADSMYIRNNQVLLNYGADPPDVGTYGMQGINGFISATEGGRSIRHEVYIENNLVVTGHNNSIGIEGGGTNIFVKNNTVFHPTDYTGGTARIAVTDSGLFKASGFMTNNLSANYTVVESDSMVSLGNITFADAREYCMDWANGDYRLKSSSEARDAANTTDASYYTTSDFEGNARDALPDVGYDEYVSAAREPRSFFIHSVLGDDGNSGYNLANAKEHYSALIDSLIPGDVVRAVGEFPETVLAYQDSTEITCVTDSLPPVFGGPKALTGFTQAGQAGGAATLYAYSRLDGYVREQDATYLTARNGAGDNTTTSSIRIGQFISTDFYVVRGIMSHPLDGTLADSLSGATIDSVRYGFTVGGDNSTTDFDLWLVNNRWGPIRSNDDFTSFAGWKASGAYDDSALTKLSTASIGTGVKEMPASAALKAMVQNALGDTAWYGMISSRDAAATEQTGNEYLIINTNTPYLKIFAQLAEALIPNLYVRAVAGAEQSMTRLWNNGSLMSKQGDGEVVDEHNQWAFSTGKDSVYIYIESGGVDNITGDGLAEYLVDYNEKRYVKVVRVILLGTGNYGHAAYMDGPQGWLVNCAVDYARKGVYALGDSGIVKNNIFTVFDSLYLETGSDNEIDYNGYITGWIQGEDAHDLLNTSDWATEYEVPPEAWRDKGVDVGLAFNGAAPELGPVELDALEEETNSLQIWYDGTLFRYGRARPIHSGGQPLPVHRR